MGVIHHDFTRQRELPVGSIPSVKGPAWGMVRDVRLVFSAPKRTENSPNFVVCLFRGESSTQVGFASRRNSEISGRIRGLMGGVCVSGVLPSVLLTQNSCESWAWSPSPGCARQCLPG